MSDIASVVIVGGGLAGVSTAAALRSGGYVGELYLVDAGAFPYDRPPLSKDFLSGAKDLAQLALQPAEWYAEQDVRLLNRSTVTSVDADSVVLSDGTVLPADRIVLATGGRAALPPIPGADGPRVHVLRDVEDAERLKAALVPGARILVVGGGLIGAETAASALALGCEVVLAEPGTPLAASVGPEMAEWLHAMHPARGIDCLAARVLAFEDGPDGVRAKFEGAGEGQELREFDAVVVGVGLAPRTGLAEAAGLEVDGGVIVDAGQTTSNPAILAVGDSARRRIDGDLRPCAGHWEAAQDDGRRAAATILGKPLPAEGASWWWSDRHGVHVEAVGSMAAADTTVVRGAPGAAFAVFGLRDGRVVAAVAVDDSGAVRAARRMIDRGTEVDAAALADLATDLRRLLRR
ncbi:NAD/ferredoxin-dependent reductase-like protein [Actinocorallia herbida]|uniref:NAD/ferredoxin-dependent reductase-like protein n=1 Tax=Actinocorallia herbida TaxID=58109 RepID=A0A3N1CTS5_9ACTN|nr:FAD-dependent oxidoreductase [Actinocorallia herbida]ROO84710.1 NAD/ferredoxin-dependent reductase-like protein [Actinocorallia herbida]